MKRCMLALLLGLLVSSSSGCCLFDKILGHGACNTCCGYPGCGPACGAGGCGPACGPGGCGPGGCGNGGCLGCNDGGATEGMDDGSAYAGPPSAGVTYPYYTTRGPRDFLAKNPRSIGPN
jgi:hypothetical protein